jgi:hypothetical protein
MQILIFRFICLLLSIPGSAKAAADLVELVKNVKPSVVLIQTFDANSNPIGLGSGFFISNKGHLITNEHIIKGAFSATVKTTAGKEYPVQGIIAKDSEADIVKLSVNIPDNNVVPLKLTTTIPSEGENVIVIGNPLGFESSVSTGIVSAVRDIPTFGKILQITAAISPGSSGSPVLNTKGEVVGVVTLVATEGQNINFAIPSNKVVALEPGDEPVSLREYAENSKERSLAEYGDESLVAEKPVLYHNPQGHFFFMLPAGWEEIPKDAIEASLKILREQYGHTLASNYDGAFQKIGTNYFAYPYIMFQIDKSGRWPENEIKKSLSSNEWEKAIEKGLHTVEEQLPTLIQNSRAGQTTYDKERNIVFTKMESGVAGIGKIVALTAIILSNYGNVALFCYSTKENFDNELPYFTEIINSFRYDIGYEYGQVTKDNYIAKTNSAQKSHSLHALGWTVLVVGILATVVTLIAAKKS